MIAGLALTALAACSGATGATPAMPNGANGANGANGSVPGTPGAQAPDCAQAPAAMVSSALQLPLDKQVTSAEGPVRSAPT